MWLSFLSSVRIFSLGFAIAFLNSMVCRTLIITFLICGVLAQGRLAGANQCLNLFRTNPLTSDLLQTIPHLDEGPGFIAPNERQIGVIRKELEKVPSGVYVTVGTERGFMAAAMQGGRTIALVLIDRDQKVNLYNLINRSLLALAKNREHYLQLRLKSNFSDIQKVLKISPELSAENKSILANEKAWQWWQYHVQESLEWMRFHQPAEKNPDRAFENANYLFDDQLYGHISRLAKLNRIFVIHDDLGSVSVQARIANIVNALHSSVSMLDFSNAWQIGYLGHAATIRFMQELANLMSPTGRTIFTYLTRGSANSNESEFGYKMISVEDQFSLSLLTTLLGQMEMSEPGRNVYRRSRMERDGF